MQHTSPDVYTHISKQNNDPILERKTCRISGQQFPLFASDQEFYQRMGVPAPTLCPEERQLRRLARRNERQLYRRKCDATGKDIISIYKPDTEYTVYDAAYWHSDQRDALDYGIEFDSTKIVFEQIQQLLTTVPLSSLNNEYTLQENSDYTNSSGPGKNLYLVFEVAFSEDCMYCDNIFYCKNLLNSSHCHSVEVGYGCINCEKSQRLFFSQDCSGCSDSSYLYNCQGSSHCFMSTNLINKQYYVANTPYDSREAYEQAKQAYITEHHNLDEMFSRMMTDASLVRQATSGINNERCVANYCNNSKNTILSYDMTGCEDCRYSSLLIDSKDCYDVDSRGENATLCYELQESGRNIDHCSFSVLLRQNCSHVSYSYHCQNIQHCFGCVGLRNKQYCIFNKQYTKEQYEQLLPQVIAHMQHTKERGEFFPIRMSPFGYNETLAYDLFPMLKQNAKTAGYKRSDYESPAPQASHILQADELPTDLYTVDESLCSQAIRCEKTGKPFRINKTELAFHKQYTIPLPHRHPDQRYVDRLEARNPRALYLRNCDKTGQEMISVYKPNVRFNVYSDEAYQQKLFG